MKTVLEGLEVSLPPCARGLSVAGFLVVIGRFPAGRRFILRVKLAPFSPGRPSLFNNPGITVIVGVGKVYLVCTGCVPGVYRVGMYREGIPTRVY